MDKLERHSGSVGRLTTNGVDGVEKNADWMTTTNGIPVFLKVTEDKEEDKVQNNYRLDTEKLTESQAERERERKIQTDTNSCRQILSGEFKALVLMSLVCPKAQGKV